MYKILIGLIISLLTATTVMAQSTYAIRAGDVLQVEVLEDPTLNRNVLVLPDGSISFPLVGTVQAAGRGVAEVRSALASGLASNFAATPTVYVNVTQLAQSTAAATPAKPVTVPVYTMGEIASPGRLDVEPGTTLLQALAQSGGFTRFAAQKRVQLRRADPQTGRETIYPFNYRTGGGIPGTTVLQQGDVIVVPERRLFE